MYGMHVDRPFTMVHAISGESEQLDPDTILIFPRGVARAQVDVPEEMRHYVQVPCTRSRWARIGLQVEPISAIIIQPPETLTMFLSNWSRSYSLVVRKGDTAVALTVGIEWVKSLPPEEKIPLTADARSLRIKEGVLPKRTHKRKSVPFFDPRELDIQECMESILYDMLILKKHDFLVVPVREQPTTPDGHIGFITSAIKGLRQNSAQYDHAGSDGTRVLELKASRSIRIEPGMHIGDLTIYRISSSLPPLPPYQGTLGKSTSPIPFSLA